MAVLAAAAPPPERWQRRTRQRKRSFHLATMAAAGLSLLCRVDW